MPSRFFVIFVIFVVAFCFSQRTRHAGTAIAAAEPGVELLEKKAIS